MTDYIAIARNLAPNQVAWPSVPEAIGQLQDAIDAIVAGELVDQLIYGANVETIGVDRQLTAGEANLQVVKASTTGLAVLLPDATDADLVAGRPRTIVNPPARDEVQRLTLTGGPTGGSFKLTFSGQETGAISYSATAAVLAGAIQTALNALSNLSGIVVTAISATVFDVAFAGADGGADQALMTLTLNSLTGGTAPNVTIAERWAGLAAGEAYELRDFSGRVLATLAPGERATVRLKSGATAAGEWDVLLPVDGLAPAAARARIGVSADPFRNGVVNGGFDLWPETTTMDGASTPANSDDTWFNHVLLLSDGNDIVDLTRDATAPAGALYCLAAAVQTANKKWGYLFPLEQIDSLRFIGQTVSVSFAARTNAGAQIRNVRCAVLSWSGTADAITSDVVSAWGAEGTNPTLAANWTAENVAANLVVPVDGFGARLKVEGVAVDTAAAKNVAVFIWVDDADAAVSDVLRIGDVQIEASEKATAFARRPVGVEMAMSERLLEIVGGEATKPIANGHSYDSTHAEFVVPWRTLKRIAPSVSLEGGAANWKVRDSSATSISASAIVAALTGKDAVLLAATVASGLTAGHASGLLTDGASARIKADARL